MEPDVGLAVRREVLEHSVERDHQFLERVERVRGGALRGEHRDADLDGDPLVADVAPRGEQLRRGRTGGRLGIGHDRATAAAANGAQVSALRERHERLSERRARDPELRAQLALSRQPCAGRKQAELDRVPSRSTVSSNAVCERTGANTVSSEATESSAATVIRSQPFEAAVPPRVGHRRFERFELDVGRVYVVIDDLVAERRARDLAGGEQVAGVAERRGKARLVGRQIRVAAVRRLELPAPARPHAARRR